MDAKTACKIKKQLNSLNVIVDELKTKNIEVCVWQNPLNKHVEFLGFRDNNQVK